MKDCPTVPRFHGGASFWKHAAGAFLCLAFLLPAAAPGAGPAEGNWNELAALCRALHDRDTPVNYERLAAFAREHEIDPSGPAAALALGYRDYVRGRSSEAGGWFNRAEKGSLLAEYVLYWEAQNARVEHRPAAEMDLLDHLVRDYPASVILPQALEALAGAALERGDGQRARYALESYAKTAEHPGLLLMRARAREMDHAATLAAADNVEMYYG